MLQHRTADFVFSVWSPTNPEDCEQIFVADAANIICFTKQDIHLTPAEARIWCEGFQDGHAAGGRAD